jgi:hypothetical protein
MAQPTCASFRRLSWLALLAGGVLLALSATAWAQTGQGTRVGDAADSESPVTAQTQEAPDEKPQAPEEKPQAEAPAEAEAAAEGAEEEEGAVRLSEEVVVTGVQESLAQAVEVKGESMPIVDALVAEDINKFPDKNVAPEGSPCTEPT